MKCLVHVSNGASAEGTLNGTFNEMLNFNGLGAIETPEFLMERLKELRCLYAVTEIKTQQDSGLVDKKSAVKFGQQIGSEYLLTSNFSEIQKPDTHRWPLDTSCQYPGTNC